MDKEWKKIIPVWQLLLFVWDFFYLSDSAVKSSSIDSKHLIIVCR